ncbi:hypothetical protein ACIHDR_07985 [Nocardia sp. NPDC052278]|uniref:hypothetical protein n=1 Tax=unclassified Nocardia TaxID=2637762 RepID=UPI0036B6643F
MTERAGTTALNLKAKLHSQPVGVRPTLELEQRTGITLARVQAIAELQLHPRR